MLLGELEVRTRHANLSMFTSRISNVLPKSVVKKIKEKRMYLFYLYAAPWQAEFKRYTPFRQCMNCFGYGHLKSHWEEEERTAVKSAVATITPIGTKKKIALRTV